MKITVNDKLLYFDVENPGLIPGKNAMQALPTMIILHGGPGYDHTPYQSFFNALKNTVQIIYIDLHGNGRSDAGSPDTWNFARWASDIEQFCQLLHIDRPIIFGHSFGSMVALQYAINYPNHLQKLILCNAIAKFDLEEVAQSFYTLGGETAKNAFLNFFTNATDEAKKHYALYCAPFYSVQKIDEQAIFYNRMKIKLDILTYFFNHLIKNFDCVEQIKNIQVPTLILTGEKDPIANVTFANKIAEKLDDKCYSHVIVPDTSHNLIWENSEVVMEHMKEFITS